MQVGKPFLRLSRFGKILLILLAVACLVVIVQVSRRPPAPDPLRQPTELYPHINAGTTYRVDPDWPVRSREVVWDTVTGLAIDSADRIWVLGLGQPPVQVYDGQGNYVLGWGTGQIARGHQIRLDWQGYVWVADTERHCVYKFQPDGTLLLTLGTPGQPGEDGNHFHEPTDVAITADGDLFVADGYVNTRVVHFHGDGKFATAWGRRGHRPGEFSLVHAIVADRRDRLLVADRNNARIQIFDKSGNFLEQWCNLIVPWGLWVSPQDEVWACGSSPAAWRDDAYALATPPHDQIWMKFDHAGRVLQLWSVPLGNKPGQLDWVHCIVTDSRGNVYCGDNKGKRVQKFVLVPAFQE